jgi:hypothetical protein
MESMVSASHHAFHSFQTGHRKEQIVHLPEFRSAFLPYCLMRTKPGWYAVLHREYKPLGQTSDNWADYSKHAVRIKGIGPAMAKRLSANGDPDLERVYLYNDGCIPTRNAEAAKCYFKRLNILARLQLGAGN